MTDALVEAVARALYRPCELDTPNGWHDQMFNARAALAAIEASGTHVVMPMQPTEAMLDAARDWSAGKYGKPIGNDAANGCWNAMLSARPKQEDA